MPEGDTVWLAARRMDDALAGRVLTRTDFRVPQLATTDLAGRAVVAVIARGKHLLTRVDEAEIVFWGRCPDCRARATAPAPQPDAQPAQHHTRGGMPA